MMRFWPPSTSSVCPRTWRRSAPTPAAKRGYLLLQLASQVLSTQFPGVATNILDAAVQLAVTGAKA